jgi:hypothetical protein
MVPFAKGESLRSGNDENARKKTPVRQNILTLHPCLFPVSINRLSV